MRSTLFSGTTDRKSGEPTATLHGKTVCCNSLCFYLNYLDGTMWKVHEYNPSGVNKFPLLTFVYIIKTAESKRQIEIFYMKATEMLKMSEVKTGKSIYYNQFDPV